MDRWPELGFESRLSCCFGVPAGKEPACGAGDPGSIPGLGRAPGEGTGCPRQCSWASLVAQLVENPLAMWEIWVRSLGWEGPLEKGKAIHSSILAWRIPQTVLCVSPLGCKELDMTEQLSLSRKIKVVPFPHH